MNEQATPEQPSGQEGQIGSSMRDVVVRLDSQYNTLATREWVWRGAFLALVGGISIGVTLVGVLIKILK